MIHLPSKKRGMKKGFTLIELMVAIATVAVLIALLLPDIQKAKDASLQGSQKEGPFWVYREYEYAGGPVVSEISGSYQHSLQEILDMYVINLKKDQEKFAKELAKNEDADLKPTPDQKATEALKPDLSKNSAATSEKIRKLRRGINNLKADLTQNHACLSARRNMYTAIAELEEDLKALGAKP